MEVVIGWVFLAAVVAIVAARIGRSGVGWFLISCVLSPLIAILLLLVLGRGKTVDPEAPTPETHVRCPDCRELVRNDARKCKHCGVALLPVSTSSANAR